LLDGPGDITTSSCARTQVFRPDQTLLNDLMDLDTTNETSCEPSSSTNPSLRQQIYGGIDPEVEENFHLLEPVADGAINGSTDRDNMLPAINDSYGVWGQPRSIGLQRPRGR